MMIYLYKGLFHKNTCLISLKGRTKLTESESVLPHNALRHLARRELNGTQSVFAGILFSSIRVTGSTGEQAVRAPVASSARVPLIKLQL